MWLSALAALPLLSPPEAAASHVPYRLHELAAVAERVVCGRITALQDQTFDLAVEEVLVGGPVDELRLRRFENWMCASRWAEYAVGQRVLLFLRGDRAMGAGDEGDWPLDDAGQAVFVPFAEDGQFHRVSRPARSIPLAEVAAAVRGYRDVFQLLSEGELFGIGAVLCFASDDVAPARAYADSSPFANQLYVQTLVSRGFVSPRPVDPLVVVPLITARDDGYCPPPPPPVDSRPVPPACWGFASAMVAPGDLDRDGLDELAVSGVGNALWMLRLFDSGRRVEGPLRLARDQLGLSGAGFGEAMAALGDLDGDGIPDLAVGAPSEDPEQPGRVWLLFLERYGKVSETAAVTVPGASPGFGFSLAAVGDLDGNGAADLVVNDSPLFGGTDVLDSSRRPLFTVVFLDRDGNVLRAVPLPIDGDSRPTFGDTLLGLDDLDGDGAGELVLGVASADGESSDAVEIVFLGRDGSLRARKRIALGDLDPSRTPGDFGSSLAAPGDLDGDGVPDLVVGGRQELWILLLTRAGGVKASHSFGLRSGGFVPLQSIDSVAVFRGPEGARRLAVAGVPGHPDDSFVYVLGLGPGATLHKP